MPLPTSYICVLQRADNKPTNKASCHTCHSAHLQLPKSPVDVGMLRRELEKEEGGRRRQKIKRILRHVSDFVMRYAKLHPRV